MQKLPPKKGKGKFRSFLRVNVITKCGNANFFMHAIMKEFLDNQDIALCNKHNTELEIKKKMVKMVHCGITQSTKGKTTTICEENKRNVY